MYIIRVGSSICGVRVMSGDDEKQIALSTRVQVFIAACTRCGVACVFVCARAVCVVLRSAALVSRAQRSSRLSSSATLHVRDTDMLYHG